MASPRCPTAIPRFGKAAEGIRAACTLGRKVLDLAHAAVAPGVTTDEIDRVVRTGRREEGRQRGAYGAEGGGKAAWAWAAAGKASLVAGRLTTALPAGTCQTRGGVAGLTLWRHCLEGAL